MAQKKNFIQKMLGNLSLNVYALFNFVPSLVQFLRMEVGLACKSIIVLCALSIIAGIIMWSLWLTLLVLATLYLVSLHLTWIAAVSILVAIHLFLLIVILLFMLRAKNNLSFKKTRRLLRSFNK